MKPNTDQLKDLADFLLKFYPTEIGKGNPKGESAVEVVIRLLTPTEIVNDNNSRVPNWAVDTLAKKELLRLAQYVMNNHLREVGERGIVNTVIDMLERAYLPTS